MAETQQFKVVDCDGHIAERLDDLVPFMDSSLQYITKVDRAFPSSIGLFPALDGLHQSPHASGSMFDTGRRKRVSASDSREGCAKDWTALLDKVPIEQTVLFTSDGLSIGWLRHPEYTLGVCRAYNDWAAETYRRADKRLHPAALLPMQFPAEAAKELRRAVKELGLSGGMVPSTGLQTHLGHEMYWPVYKEAADLGAPLAVHGGCNRGIGIDDFTSMVGSHVLHHPVPLMIALVGMVTHGVFKQFPTFKAAFLEGGAGWIFFLLDRMKREKDFFPDAPSLPEFIDKGRILIGCEGNDLAITHCKSMIGVSAFAFSSDYPHEADMEDVRREIHEVYEENGLTDDEKAAVLGGNARRFYGLPA